VIIAAIIALAMLGPSMTGQMKWAFQAVYGDLLNVELTPDNFPGYFRLGAYFLMKLLGPFVLILILFGLAVSFAVSGFVFSSQAIEPKLDRLDPIKGLQRMFSIRGFAELVKGILKIIIVGVVAYFTIKGEIPAFARMLDQSISVISAGIVAISFKLALRLAIAVLILGLLDWRFQKWKYNKDLMMTRREVIDEHRMTVQYRLSMNRMIKKLPEADVVVTNPTHVAVALKYDAEKNSAPVVIAKGMRKIAERIRAIAEENDIPIVEDPPLARALYKVCEIGREIPYELYQAVAEVLAMVYRLKEKVGA
jgi:flagellar biosynthetic protein FlhB